MKRLVSSPISKISKRRKVSSNQSDSPSQIDCESHHFKDETTSTEMREKLLSWYDKNQRSLPWRTIAKLEENVNTRIYSVWVSEVMLQQTQVSTVIPYFEKWMNKWPTVSDLSKASLDEVHKCWAGLGYYSRATRLHTGSQKIMNEFGGCFPLSSTELEKVLPGVGRYTSSAIASISLGEVVPVLDGNVMRVLSRLRAVGASITDKTTTDFLWQLAGEFLDQNRPGDFNQTLMELGATICTPKKPSCESCPVSENCLALAKAKKATNKCVDIEDIVSSSECSMCLPKESWNSEKGVECYPQKAQKKESRKQVTAVVVLHSSSTDRMLLVQRPKTGLLANLWEFPNIPIPEGDGSSDVLHNHLLSYNITREHCDKIRYMGSVVHLFSHIHQTYNVYKGSLTSEPPDLTVPDTHQSINWLNHQEFGTAAVSTAMKKVLKTSLSSTKKKSSSQSLAPITNFFKKLK